MSALYQQQQALLDRQLHSHLVIPHSHLVIPAQAGIATPTAKRIRQPASATGFPLRGNDELQLTPCA